VRTEIDHIGSEASWTLALTFLEEILCLPPHRDKSKEVRSIEHFVFFTKYSKKLFYSIMSIWVPLPKTQNFMLIPNTKTKLRKMHQKTDFLQFILK